MRNRRRQRERELEEEVASYAELLAEEKRAAGLNRHQARRQAKLEMGGVESVKEKVRAARPGAWLEGLGRDLHFGMRRLRQRPGYTLAVILTLGIGIGLTAALFGAVEGLVLRPLPFPEPQQLVQLAALPSYRLVGDSARQVKPEFLPLFSDFAAYRTEAVDIEDGGAPTRISVAMVSADFFPLLGARVALGRALQNADLTRNAASAASRETPPIPVVLSERLWRVRYGGRPGIVGAQLDWSGEPYRVIGVAKPEFSFPYGAEAWIPFQNQPFAVYGLLDQPGRTNLILRLRRGVSLATAERRLDSWIGQKRHGLARTPYLLSLRSVLLGDRGELLWLLWAASGLVLGLACAGGIGLGIIQAAGRRRELTMRQALGAGSGRLRQQLLAESLLLGGASGAVGWGFAEAGEAWLRRLWPPTAAGAVPHLGPWAAVFALGIASLCGALLGLLPYRRLGGTDLCRRLQALDCQLTPPSSFRQWSLGDVLTTAQLALALALLAATAALGRSAWALTRVPTGLRPGQVLTFEVSLPAGRLPLPPSQIARVAMFQRQLRSRLAVLPGVAGVGLMGFPPFAGARFQTAFAPKGQEHADSSALYVAGDLVEAGPGSLPALGIPFLSGRDFRADDPPGCEVILSRELARALGYGPRPATVAAFPAGSGECRVVGVVGDVRQAGLRSAPPATMYAQLARSDAAPFVVIRAAPGIAPLSLLPAIHRVAADLAPTAPLSQVAMLASLVDRSHADLNHIATLFSLFALLATAMAGLSVFTLATQSALARTREVAIRTVLGADRREIRKLLLLRPMALMALALPPAYLLAWALQHAAEHWLFEVSPGAPSNALMAAAGLAALAGLASYLPARRAARMTPVTALRQE